MENSEDLVQLLVVLVEPLSHSSLKLVQPFRERRVGAGNAAELDEGPHDLDVHGDRSIAAKDAGEHRDSLLGENQRTLSPTSVPAT